MRYGFSQACEEYLSLFLKKQRKIFGVLGLKWVTYEKIAGEKTSKYHCDALGSPRKMTNEAGTIIWSATYYPFGEMNAGGTNTHGFTGKEFDSEMSLNYSVFVQILDLFRSQNGNSRLAEITKTRILAVRDFCQRYYDPEIGRFMELDTWTNLPDDERLLSHEKYLSWDNYELNCIPQKPATVSAYRLKYKNQDLAYDTLSSALVSFQSRPSLSFDTASIRIYPMNLMNYGMKPSRYLTYNHQLNGYLYCMNNPLRYIDPTGNIISLIEVAFELLVVDPIRQAAWEWISQQMERWCGKHVVYQGDFWAPDALGVDHHY